MKDPFSPLRQHFLHVLRAAEGVIDWALDNGAHPGARAVHELVTETIFSLEVEEGERSPPAQPQTEGQQGSNDSLAQRVYLQGFDEIFGKPKVGDPEVERILNLEQTPTFEEMEKVRLYFRSRNVPTHEGAKMLGKFTKRHASAILAAYYGK